MAAAAAAAALSATSWGDEAITSRGDAVPPPSEEYDSPGHKRVTSYRRNEAGQLEKVVRIIRVIEHEKRIPLGAIERAEKWRKFGHAASSEESGITMQQKDPISIQRPGEVEKSSLERMVEETGGGSTKSCRRCGGPHWSAVCPYKNMAVEDAREKAAEAAAGAGAGGAAGGGGAGGVSGKYVPPSQRTGAAAGAAVNPADIPEEELTQLRVGNLSDEASEEDLRALFGQFGTLDKVYIAYDRVTNEPRGFAFVRFLVHSSAKAAKTALHRFPLRGLIINVEWSRPSAAPAGGPTFKYSGYGKKLAQDMAPPARGGR